MTKRVNAGTSQKSAPARKARFVEAYIENGYNATQAAITAGYSAKSARRIGTRLSTNVHIAAEIHRRTKQSLEDARMRTGISRERTLREAARLAFYDIGKLFDENSRLKDPREWGEETAAAVA